MRQLPLLLFLGAGCEVAAALFTVSDSGFAEQYESKLSQCKQRVWAGHPPRNLFSGEFRAPPWAGFKSFKKMYKREKSRNLLKTLQKIFEIIENVVEPLKSAGSKTML